MSRIIIPEIDSEQSKEESSNNKIEAHFTNIEEHICKYIDRSDQVWICSAWFSSLPILDKASLRTSRLIISDWNRLKKGSSDYNSKLVSNILNAIPETYIYSGDILMHHKFILLIENGTSYAVITGSYNYTFQAKTNLENIVYIEDKKVASLYADEFERILSLSKQLRS